jgi:hypothetical protein
MLYFNQVLQIAEGGRLQVMNRNLSHAYNMGRPLATDFTVVRLEDAPRQQIGDDLGGEAVSFPHASFQSESCGGSGGYWSWTHKIGSADLAGGGDAITIKDAGIYLVMVRVPGVHRGNSGYAELMLDGTVIGEAWSNNANGYHNMLYFNQVLQIAEGGRLQVMNRNLSHSYNMGSPLATNFTLIRMRA